jgi:hypothetical protein
MNGSVIVWDLETVPDLRGFAAANGLAGKTDEEVREAIGEKFPKHIYVADWSLPSRPTTFSGVCFRTPDRVFARQRPR